MLLARASAATWTRRFNALHYETSTATMNSDARSRTSSRAPSCLSDSATSGCARMVALLCFFVGHLRRPLCRQQFLVLLSQFCSILNFQLKFQVLFVARPVRARPSCEFHLKFLRTICLSSFQVCLRTLLQPHSRGLSDKFKFKFLFKFRRTFYLS